MFYKAIWLLLQICFTVYETLRQFCWRLQLTLGRSYDRRRNRYENSLSYNEVIYLEKCSTELSKLPHHLSIIFGPEESDVDNELVLRLITFAMQTSIDCISFYDARPDSKHRLSLHKFDPPKHIHSKELGKEHLLWTNNKTTNGVFCNGNGNTNGYLKHQKKDHSIQIYKFELFQGHSLIAEVCRDWFQQRQTDEIQELLQKQKHLSQRLDEELSLRLYKCKDPELCIIFSKYMCTYGLLPWQTRFTEFHLHQQGNLFDANNFAKILFQYAKCEQRWGK